VKPLVYVAGPYTHPDPVINVHRACLVADRLDAHGCAVFVPHLSITWHLVSPQPDVNVWYRRDLDVLEHCDAVVRIAGESVGADAETDRAYVLGLPVFRLRSDNTFPPQLEAWLAQRTAVAS